MRDQHGEMLLAGAGQQSGDQADAEAAAQVAHQRAHAADVVVFLLWDAGVAKHVDGDEEEGQADGDEGAPTDGHAEADGEAEFGHAPQADRW